LNYWKHQEGISGESGIRQRRPIPSPNHLVRAIVADTENLHSDKSDTGAVSKLHVMLRESFLSDRAILALTWLVSIAACSLQFYSFITTQQAHGRQHGSVHDADFLTNVQQSLMQLLTLYTSLVPALRTQTLRRRYALWVWALSVSGCMLGIVSAAIYPCFTAMSPLLGMFGNVIQAGLVLQLVLCIEPIGSSGAAAKVE